MDQQMPIRGDSSAILSKEGNGKEFDVIAESFRIDENDSLKNHVVQPSSEQNTQESKNSLRKERTTEIKRGKHTSRNSLFLTMFCCIGGGSNSVRLKISYLATTFFASSIIFVFIQELVISQLTNGYSIINLYDGYLFGPPPQVVFDMGALDTNLVRSGQLARLFWSFWLHTGFIHLIINLSCQVILGIILETRWVIWRYAILYILGGISGNLASAVLDPCTISAGSSSCFFALLAGIIVLLLENWRNSRWQFLYILLVIIASLIGISLSFMSNTDNWAHIGGFVSGLLWSFASIESFPRKSKSSQKSIKSSRKNASSLPSQDVQLSLQVRSTDVEAGHYKSQTEETSLNVESISDYEARDQYLRSRFTPLNCSCSGGVQTVRVISLLILLSLLTIGFLFLLYKPLYTKFNLVLGHLSFSGIQKCSCCDSPEGLFWCSSSPTWIKRCG
ncbi:rhomboid family membrane associated protease [Cryptosporidium sp. chipmunk genotype I]|uniref:rhomboid family membrane associated protease n=1 Tax=Cryptosporidium sp. chipmunk genotype I TaxID=1280935 RepID=UPI00351A8860|nr:rhomboid family membrane associated protease [Cryptosporidium sp. chipmunk genotype I]